MTGHLIVDARYILPLPLREFHPKILAHLALEIFGKLVESGIGPRGSATAMEAFRWGLRGERGGGRRSLKGIPATHHSLGRGLGCLVGVETLGRFGPVGRIGSGGFLPGTRRRRSRFGSAGRAANFTQTWAF